MDLWFGDSWPIGSELGKAGDIFDKTVFPNVKVGRDNPLQAFPHFVSTSRNSPYINFSRGASSIDYALHQLIKFCNNSYDPTVNYTAFLCATAQNRGFAISATLNKEMMYCNTANKTQHDLFIYDSIIALNSFHAICHLYNIECFIIPVFCDLLIPDCLSDLVLFSDSVLTSTSLVMETFGVDFVESTMHHVPNDDHTPALCAHLDWISPCLIHPNLMGHKKLADKLVELVKNR